MEKYVNFMTTGTKEQIDPWLGQLDALYAQGNEAISDEMYDHLVMVYESRFGKRLVVGAAPPLRGKVQLPVAMMSLDKIMKPKELEGFVKKNPGPYVVMDKVNGNAGLYTVTGGQTRLYNRGDGTEGTDLTHVLPYLNLPVLPFDVHVKGELVVNKKDYEPFKQDYRTNLSMVAGLLNSQSADPARLKLIRFVAYDMSFPNNPEIELKMSDTLKHMVKYGFTIPFNLITPALTVEWLSKFFKQQKANQVYDVDGMVIVADRPVKYGERLVRENPKYAIAFKEYGEVFETTVTGVVWEASKHGVIKPVVHVVHTPVGNGFTIRKATGFNAKWIVDNNVGPGALIQVTHNTIPYILGVVQGTEPQMPPVDKYPTGSWAWNETGVDIVLHKPTDEVKIARIYEFFKKIGAKYWGETTLAKFYNGGYNTIKQMVETTREQFGQSDIAGIGGGIIDRMVQTRDAALPQVSLPQLMAASGQFGLGLGERKIRVVTNAYPNILDIIPTVEQITALDGFAQKTAEKFVAGLPKFKQFIKNIPILERVARGQLRAPSPLTQPTHAIIPGISPVVGAVSPVVGDISPAVSPVTPAGAQDIRGKSVVFTGFRDKALENGILARGGDVKTGVSKKTAYLLVGGPKGQGSGKEKKAIQYGVPVLSVAEFKAMFGF